MDWASQNATVATSLSMGISIEQSLPSNKATNGLVCIGPLVIAPAPDPAPRIVVSIRVLFVIIFRLSITGLPTRLFNPCVLTVWVLQVCLRRPNHTIDRGREPATIKKKTFNILTINKIKIKIKMKLYFSFFNLYKITRKVSFNLETFFKS